MVNFLKIIGLASLAVVSLFFLTQLIPAASIEISSENSQSTALKKEASIFKNLSSLAFNGENKSDQKNILLLGRPGQSYTGGQLTDTIILAHLNLKEKKSILISLPRDLLVKIPSRQMSEQPATKAEQSNIGLTKINSLYQLTGIKGLKEKIEEITGLSINHYVLVDLVVVEEIIKLVDGLNVYVPQDINDPYFPGPNYAYQTFILKAGWRYLNGQTALKYIRTRYTSPNGDFDRMARQQQIIRLLKQKVLSLNLLWDFPTYLKIFNTLKNHIETDLGLMEMKSLYQVVQEMEINQINHLVIDKKRTDLLTSRLIELNGQTASVVYPKTGQGNYQAIKDYIKKTINGQSN